MKNLNIGKYFIYIYIFKNIYICFKIYVSKLTQFYFFNINYLYNFKYILL